jgi:glycosyltransferase involved in cell wall biosynthesis
MKIAVITTSQVPASTANSIQALKVCQALAHVSGPVRLWVPGNQAVSWEALSGHYGLHTPFDITWLTSRRVLRRYDFALQALREARRWGADVIYTWTAQAAVLALYQRMPVIYEVHDRPSGRFGPWLLRQIVRTPGKKRLLVITEALRQRLESQLGLPLPPDLAQIAPSGVDLERYAGLPDAPAARRELGLAGMYHSRIYRAFLCRARDGAAVEAGRTFPASAVLMGRRSRRRRRTLAADTRIPGTEQRSAYRFYRNSKLPLYQAAADVLLMPYERSVAVSSGGDTADVCSPMKMFDYLAAGRAIISSDLPVLQEVLNEKNALFCSPDDPFAWEKALETLLADPQRREQFGQQARRDAERYTLQERARRALVGFEE